MAFPFVNLKQHSNPIRSAILRWPWLAVPDKVATLLEGIHVSNMMRAKSRDLVKMLAAARLCPNKIRAKLLRSLGWKIGAGSIVHWGVLPVAPNVIIGAGAFIGTQVYFDGHGTIEIGDQSRIGPFSKILSTTHPIENSVPRRIAGKDYDLDTKIGFGCWVGTSVMILPGVKVADGCVLAAGSVVTKDTEPNGLYAGVPARRVRDLHTDGSPPKP